MHRREFICSVAGAVIGAPSLTLRTASAQQAAKIRRVGILMGLSESNIGAFFTAFVEELARLGWTDGRNVRFEQRWTNGDPNRASAFATADRIAARRYLLLDHGGNSSVATRDQYRPDRVCDRQRSLALRRGPLTPRR